MLDYPPYLFHPVAVHFTVALLFFAALLYVGALARKEAGGLRAAADWSFGGGLVAILITAGFGLLAYYTVAHDEPSHAAMTDHRNWALGTLIAFVALGVWRWRSASIGALFVAGMVAGSVLLGITGMKGGHLVFEYGMGVQSLPAAEGSSHDHAHGGGVGEHENGGEHSASDGGHAHQDGAGDHEH